MKIKEIIVKDFGGIETQIIEPQKITCLLGKNGASKSTILTAIKRAFIGKMEPDDIRIGASKAHVTIVFDDGTTGGYPRDTNVVLYIGTVRHAYCPTNELTILTIKIPNQDKSNQVEICCFASQAEAARNLKIGDAVAAAGYITSNTRSVNDRVEFRQSVVCRDISQIDGVLG